MDVALWAGIAIITYGCAILALAVLVRRGQPDHPVSAAFLHFAVLTFLPDITYGPALILWTRSDATLHPLGDALFAANSVVILFFWLAWLRLAAVATQSRLLTWILGRRTTWISITITALLSGVLVWMEVQDSAWDNALRTGIAMPIGVLVIAAAITAWIRTPNGLERRRAGAYALAFSIHDSIVLFFTTWVTVGAFTDAAFFGAYWHQMWLTSFVVLLVGFLPAVTYGMLTGAILGVERKLQWGLSNGAAAVIIAVLFVVATESIEQLFEVQDAALSVAVAVALAFAFRPIQAWTLRGVGRILPTPGVTVAEYQAAVKRALLDGKVTPQERRMLDDLRRRM